MGRPRPRLLAALLLACVTLVGGTRCGGSSDGAPGGEAITLPGFLIGTSQGGADSIPIAAALGAQWMRTQVTWRQVEPILTEAPITVADVDANLQWIHEYIAKGSWASSDAMLSQMLAAGLSPLVIVGHGYTTALPTIGGAPGGQVVKFWQLENELNQAFFTAVWGWRAPSYQEALGSAWEDWSFVTELLRTLSRAVRAEDPDAWNTVNFHSDVPESFNRLYGLPSWQASIAEWLPLVDGLQSVERYWGLVRKDGSHKPAWDVFAAFAADVP